MSKKGSFPEHELLYNDAEVDVSNEVDRWVIVLAAKRKAKSLISTAFSGVLNQKHL